MKYEYENLTDETFQELCHNIISQEFPDSQAFPIGQPDGGRDTIIYEINSSIKEFFVFQVKYVRSPNKIDDVHKWLVKIMEKEAPKVNELIPIGAKKFYLLTNVKGTGHLASGSIDNLNSIFEKSIAIPAICWWRDDLDRKLDGNINLKWSYPQLLNGQDILNSVLFNQLEDENHRKQNVIRAYLGDQYQMENDVKFKQIELESNLFELFVDVPIEIKDLSNTSHKRKFHIYHELIYRYQRHYKGNIENRQTLGAAFFLLNSQVQTKINRILLEGGPGQGKSTITQFICQVHRANLLEKIEELSAIPKEYKENSLRLPFKIDLRELASWISGKNPYSNNISENWFNNNHKNSLEGFLIAHIYYHSSVENFDINDLISVCKSTPILLVFDGFDEIADVVIREKIIETINQGIRRLSENIKSIQLIITSRPAAFANSAKFSTDQYLHFQLSDINNTVINEYLEKWIKGKKLKSREASDVRNIVKDKLELPHLRDLARSPMQLAILLSLINTRGESLPNKRTELYDSYIDLFFNREAEKNIIVRNKRDLIINIHRYLAWILHSEAELLNNNGRIEVSALKEKLKYYLTTEGHSTEIAEQLFTVMEERVCAIVSRVQGTFEFEVQPLREYFCAKFLYDTSPYTPVGKTQQGTLPDRFDALIKNFYWENVLRFFAGCFDRGELPMLIDKLKEANETENLKYTNYIRLITSELLSDFVFAQYPKLLTEVMKIITNGINIGSILNGSNNIGPNAISLPVDCGREELVDECFKALSYLPSSDYADELLSIIVVNKINNAEKWLNFSEQYRGKSLDKWLQYGRQLQILYIIDSKRLKELLLRDGEISFSRLKILLDSNRTDIIDQDLTWRTKTFDGILSGKIITGALRAKRHSFTGISMLFNPYMLQSIYSFNLNGYSSTSFIDFIYRRLSKRTADENAIVNLFIIENPNDIIDRKIGQYYQLVSPVLDLPINSWSNSIKPWSTIIDTAENIFGQQWIFKVLAVIASGIKSTEDTFAEISSLHSTDLPLTNRVRAARLKSGHVTWWKTEFDSTPDFMFSLLTFLTWTTGKTLSDLLFIIDKKLTSFSDDELIQFSSSYSKTANLSYFNTLQQKQLIETLEHAHVSENLLYFISLRFPDSTRNKFIKKFLDNYTGENNSIISTKLEYALREFFERQASENLLEQIKKLYLKLNNYRFGLTHTTSRITIPHQLATTIMKDCKSYPKALVFAAEYTCRLMANNNSMAIGKIAIDEKWFQE